jgi:hypothetical protein
LVTEKIAHVLETFDTLEVGRSGYERILNIVTDLPVSAGTPGFDAKKLHALAQEIGKLLGPGDYVRSTVRYKGNAPSEVIAKAERRLAGPTSNTPASRLIPTGRLPASDCASSAPKRRSSMPKGPRGEKRPAAVIGNAVRVMLIATGAHKGRPSRNQIPAAVREMQTHSDP